LSAADSRDLEPTPHDHDVGAQRREDGSGFQPEPGASARNEGDPAVEQVFLKDIFHRQPRRRRGK
jgi:hypothetical protein